ncbi:ABC transporter substrate-binding protein [Methylobrevis pamukkalensis]|uniref:Periplasmic dipeptide transport protein n=1 Tax=Methylobrevis pamukkalensis TaxID=1439726 RepID=A0A1E3GZ82_9HYPH|nr:ABC transporter substrate-binding protein [Methylobrevis pamukkalensis]ODN69353.1 Periplasmic dipeptide transport protein precursor [Methylobrevis pamukkalensis]
MAPTRPLHGASPETGPETSPALPAFGPHPDRRGFLKGAAFLLSAAGLALMPARPVQAARGRRHGLSFFGDLKYPEGFANLDYVNLDAPKGGEVATQVASWGFNQNPTTFNTLNSYVLQGDGAAGMGLTSVTLMTGTLDTLDNLYGFLAEGVEVSEDGKTYRFFLRQGATFHDGSPITADDVVFSLEILKSDGHPNLALELGGVAEIVAEDAATVKVVYTSDASRSLPLTVAGGIPVFSKAWWQGRDFKASLSEAPLGSGLYRLKDFRFGNSIRFERVAGHWAENLPVMRGTTNFDIIRYDYYGDRTAGFEALKKGSTTFREEFSSRVWATGYDFPAVTDGRVRRDEVPDGTSAGTQAGISTCAARNSPTRGCARRSPWSSTSSGPTRT